jgi:translation initiation factor IF-1
MKVGTLVEYITPPEHKKIVGTVTKVKGKKWVRVEWSDKVIYDEHVCDLKSIS